MKCDELLGKTPGEQLERVRGGGEASCEGDAAVVPLLAEADPVGLAGQQLPAREVEALNVAGGPGVVLQAVSRCPAPVRLFTVCHKDCLTSRGLCRPSA